MRFTKSERNILIGLLGVLIAVAAYCFGYKKLTAKAEELAAENDTMESQISIYESWLPNQETYEQGIEEMQAAIAEWVNLFPANNLYEDDIKIAFTMDTEETDPDYIYIYSMSFSDATLLYTTDYTTDTSSLPEADQSLAQSAQAEYPTYSLYGSTTSYSISCSYSGLKDMIETIYEKSDRKSVETVSVGFDSATGLLSGSVVMNDYILYGTDKFYSQPDLPSIRTGTDNIFGTIDPSGGTSEDDTGEGDTAGESTTE